MIIININTIIIITLLLTYVHRNLILFCSVSNINNMMIIININIITHIS